MEDFDYKGITVNGQTITEIQRNADGSVDIEDHADAKNPHVLAMEWGNRVCHVPSERLTGPQAVEASGLCNIEEDLPGKPITINGPERLPRVPRLWKYGKVIQLVGGAPEGMDFLRPKGVDEVWAINPRPYWPEDKQPDLIVTRDIGFIQGPTPKEPMFVKWGVEILERWPTVPIAVTADMGYWIAERTILGLEPKPPHFYNRKWWELSLHNLFDTQFAALAGFSVGLAVALARHAGCKIVLTGVGGLRSDATYKEQGSRGYKSEYVLRNEDLHINQELAAFCNRYGGKSVWHHGPVRAIGSVAPDWPA